MTAKPPLTLLIAAPRGFCAGVDRAIRIVELALERYGAPVYVRHEIVHNRFVVDSLKAKGAIFVPELDQVPDGAPVVFSAHGVPKAIPARAEERGLNYLDATCPLVSKVHRQAERLIEYGRHILFVGHEGHPEVSGTFGQVPAGRMTLVESAADAEAIQPADPDRLAFHARPRCGEDRRQQLPDEPVGEPLLQRLAAPPEALERASDLQGRVQQRGLADPRRAFDHDRPPSALARGGHRVAQHAQLAIAL